MRKVDVIVRDVGTASRLTQFQQYLPEHLPTALM